MNFLKFLTERFKAFFTSTEAEAEDPDEQDLFAREKVVAFSIAFVFALSLWFVVNMNRDFNISVEVPIVLTNLPDHLALRSEVPDHATVSVTGEGWQLISLYSNPPRVNLNAENQQINLFEQIRNMSGPFSDLNVVQVEPLMLTIETEEKATKRVPVISRIDLNLRSQFGLIGTPTIEPDSVTLTGADSILDELNGWETVQVSLDDVHQSLERTVKLRSPSGGLSVDASEITFRVDVAEFTEAEVRVPIRTRNLPSGQAVSFNPSSIIVRFDVPIHQYSEVQGTRPFAAYVNFEDLELDDTGYIVPNIEIVNDNYEIRLRSFQPPRVSYFNIIPD
ncbi:CdaR family protein [Rhodohalobacter halophilus]|uniref:CdaR family protein n=1 Tax=Rhodohalobacter halophilus TaxID=1812810 RepID=UPI00083FAD42|nr:CdaR family protein [Rhodohalobacter halophilus]